MNFKGIKILIKLCSQYKILSKNEYILMRINLFNLIYSISSNPSSHSLFIIILTFRVHSKHSVYSECLVQCENCSSLPGSDFISLNLSHAVESFLLKVSISVSKCFTRANKIEFIVSRFISLILVSVIIIFVFNVCFK